MLYGKWRPQGFAEVAGQNHVVATLRNALATGQVAHAYLFSGPRGTGKTTTARILARAVNCTNLDRGEPCNRCDACIAIGRGSALDLVEMDAASNRGIEDIRQLREKIAFAPSDLQKKVYLLDEVHMLTQGAFNALLKTLEEPPPHAIFILATTEVHELPATIVSRCQRYDFHRVPNEAVVSRLRFICEQEQFEVPDQGLLMVAIQSRGGLRDAITLLEQVVARYGAAPSTDEVLDALGLVHDERSLQLALMILDGDLAGALDLAREVADDGVSMARFTRETIDHFREALPMVLREQPVPDSPVRALAEAALRQRRGAAPVVAAVQELAKADFRLDPASPVPLEIALSTVILGPLQAVAAPAMAAAAPAPAPGGAAPQQRGRPAQGGRSTGDAPPADLTPNERLMRDLYEHCRLANPRLGGWLNGSCRILAIEDDVLELGFWNQVHLQKVDTDVRPLVEEKAQALLNRPVRLKVTLLDREQAPPPGQKPRSSGHLARLATGELGAVPVGKGS